MPSIEKLYRKVVQNPQDVSFAELVRLSEAFGFVNDRTKGSHHLFRHKSHPIRLNLQPDGKSAKPYQVRQLLRLIERYNISLTKD